MPRLVETLADSPAVALLGPRQTGKTTLALEVGEALGALYLDLESEADRAKLAQPELYLAGHSDRLVIVDEVHRAPGLFPVLRGLIDRARRAGRRAGQFLLLGSASLDLLKQSGETLAGRIAYLELGPFDVLETGSMPLDDLWLRGGFPESLLARDGARSLRWRQDFIRTYLERDIPQFGLRIAAETLRRYWTMLAHHQGGLLNTAQFARGLGVDVKTAAAYLDLLVDLLLVWPGGGLWAIEIKRSLTPKLERGFHAACADLKPERKYVVYSGRERYPMGGDIEAIPLRELAELVRGGPR
jgi:hypothetical protein